MKFPTLVNAELSKMHILNFVEISSRKVNDYAIIKGATHSDGKMNWYSIYKTTFYLLDWRIKNKDDVNFYKWI